MVTDNLNNAHRYDQDLILDTLCCFKIVKYYNYFQTVFIANTLWSLNPCSCSLVWSGSPYY